MVLLSADLNCAPTPAVHIALRMRTHSPFTSLRQEWDHTPGLQKALHPAHQASCPTILSRNRQNFQASRFTAYTYPPPALTCFMPACGMHCPTVCCVNSSTIELTLTSVAWAKLHRRGWVGKGGSCEVQYMNVDQWSVSTQQRCSRVPTAA